jgi:hypothetical protein
VIKFRSTTSFTEKAKPSATCLKILRNVNVVAKAYNNNFIYNVN